MRRGEARGAGEQARIKRLPKAVDRVNSGSVESDECLDRPESAPNDRSFPVVESFTPLILPRDSNPGRNSEIFECLAFTSPARRDDLAFVGRSVVERINEGQHETLVAAAR